LVEDKAVITLSSATVCRLQRIEDRGALVTVQDPPLLPADENQLKSIKNIIANLVSKAKLQTAIGALISGSVLKRFSPLIRQIFGKF
jgi:hypothetical protein